MIKTLKKLGRKVLDCTVCQAPKMHRFDGVQNLCGRKLRLWTCCTCGGTQSEPRP